MGMGGKAISPEASPVMARGVHAPYTISNVCGRTRVVLSLTLVLCILLWSSYLYSVDISQAGSSVLRHEIQRFRPFFKSDDEVRSHYQYRPIGHSFGKISEINFRPIRAGRNANLGKRQAQHRPISRVWSPYKNRNNNRIVVMADKSDDRAGVDEESTTKLIQYSPEEEIGDFNRKLNTKERVILDRDLTKKVALFDQKKQMGLKENSHLPEPNIKIKTLHKGRMLDTVRDKISTEYKSSDMRTRHLKAQFNFNTEYIRRQGSRVKINKALFHDKWIVVTSVLQPSPDVIFLSKIPGWKLLVVGDTRTPSSWSLPNCVFLNVADQEKLGLSLADHTPYRSYARKNLGYLFAIAHGAKVIYETDDDNRPLDLLKSFQLAPTMSGLMFAGEELFNAYHHFGQSTLWPRGYPLSAVGTTQTNLYRLSSKWKTPAIQQGVVNGDPDMDAIFRLTRKRTTSRLKVNFDPAGPPVILPEGVYSPFNSQNTLFRYEALWAMLLPTTTTFRMCDIWRGYWAQRLLWEIGARLAFYPPNAYQQRNAHSYMEDAKDEQDMYFQTDRLLEFLTDWQCPQEFSFFQCVYLLSSEMAHQKFWKAGDVEVTKLWLQDLIGVGYREPKRLQVFSKNMRESENLSLEYETGINQRPNRVHGIFELEAKRLMTLKNGTSVYFAASQQNPPTVYAKTFQKFNPANHQVHAISTLCSELKNISVNMDAIAYDQKTFFDDILLVVVFNWPHYANVKYMETIYRNVFPNIAYCGGNPDIFLAQTKDLDMDLTFINAPVVIGVYGYTCFIAAAQMGYNVTGYMVVGDDVLVNMWNFHGFDKERIWSNFAVHIFDVDNGTNWSWWSFQMGEKAYKKSMAAIKRQLRLENLNQDKVHDDRKFENALLNNNLPTVKPASAFLSTLHRNTGGPTNCPHAVSDVYYIPARLAPNAVHYMSLFARQGLMVELAISMTIYGLSLRDDIQFFSGDNLWLEERLDPWHKFNPRNFFLHPVKFSNTSNQQPLCSMYLTTFLNKMYTVDSGPNGPNDSSFAARKAYIEKLQKIYRYRQNLQKTWLEQEILAMKKNKEQRKDLSEPEDEKVEQKLTDQRKRPQKYNSRVFKSKEIKSNEKSSLLSEKGEREKDQSDSNQLSLEIKQAASDRHVAHPKRTHVDTETLVKDDNGNSRHVQLKLHQSVPRQRKEGSNKEHRDQSRNSQSQRKYAPRWEVDQPRHIPQELDSETHLEQDPQEQVLSVESNVEDAELHNRAAYTPLSQRKSVKRHLGPVASKITLKQKIKDEY